MHRRLYEWLFGDLRYRLNYKIRNFERKVRAQERDLDRLIIDTSRIKLDAERNFNHAQREKRHEDVHVYATALAHARIRDRDLRVAKSRLHGHLERLRHRAQLAVQANNIVEMNQLMNDMMFEMTDIKVVTNAVRQIDQSETKCQVLQDTLDDASSSSETQHINEEVEAEVARIMANSVPNPPMRVEQKEAVDLIDVELEQRIQRL